jgi:hypothetical protein
MLGMASQRGGGREPEHSYPDRIPEKINLEMVQIAIYMTWQS